MTADFPINEPLISRSVHGLKKECLSYGEVLAQSVSVIAPTTVPAAVLSFAYGAAGKGTWLSFLLAMIGLLFVGINVNQFARRSASPGSLYSYIVKGLGPTAGSSLRSGPRTGVSVYGYVNVVWVCNFWSDHARAFGYSHP